MNPPTLLRRHSALTRRVGFTRLGVLQRHPALRWLAPLGVLAVAAAVTTGLLKPSAPSRTLPHTSPASLVADLQGSPEAQFTGTVVSTFSMGLPGLPDVGNIGDGSSFTSLLSGSHTMQVWYGGSDQQRVALFGSTDETDVFRHGRSLWQWSSGSRTAVHLVLPAEGGASSSMNGATGAPVSPASVTPASIAGSAVRGLDRTTTVQVGKGHDVADRSTYRMTLTPHDSDTRISRMSIAVDGATKVPLAVQVYARGDNDPVVNVQFTSIRFTHPSKRNFSFTPPADARVHSLHIRESTPQSPAADGLPSVSKRPVPPSPKDHFVSELGEGWARVLSTQLPAATADALRQSTLYSALRPVSGSWGSGRVLDTDLLTILITKGGRVFVGAVDPDVLYSYAGAK